MGNLPDHILHKLDGYEIYTLRDLYARTEEAEKQNERATARIYYREALILESQIRRKYN